MAVTGTRTVRQLVTRALRKAGLVGLGEDADAEMAAVAVEEMEAMLKAWQTMPWMWTRTSGSLTLTTAASYTLDPVRPVCILSARLKRGGIETPMESMTRREYDDLPQKTTTGLPTTYHYDRQREAAVLYVWPVLAAANGETVEYTYTRELEDIASLNDVADVPGEWWDCVSMNLAARLAWEFERPRAAEMTALAADALDRAAAGEMTESVFFQADHR